ncbi:PQQ-like beta-propeller repeat protein [Verrucomicrobiales bacterium]|nr:PQQ-like beta-propeller repeat protein [Verrucomicrobiales bacterium]
MRKKLISCSLFAAFAFGCSLFGEEPNPVKDAALLNGGIIVTLDLIDVTQLKELASNPSLRVQALLEENEAIEPLRKSIHQAGKYGQISVNLHNGLELPYIDNLVNLAICDQSTKIPRDEIMRVLTPLGTLYVKTDDGYERIVKSVPKGMDEWNQFLHNAANNGVSRDDVGPPQRMRWHNTPETGRAKASMPSVTCMVTANGVLFTVEDRATPEDVHAPFDYHLVARDAFNGIELWKHPVKEWSIGGKTTSIKSVSSQLQRRLVAIGEHVYFTMGFDEPISKFHGRSGEKIKLLSGTESTREVAVEGGILYGIQGPGYGLVTEEAAREKRRTETSSAPEKEILVYAYDLNADKMRWTVPLKSGYIGASVCANKKIVAYLAGNELVCLDKETGTIQWASAVDLSEAEPKKGKKKSKGAAKTKKVPGEDFNIHPTLVLAPNKAFCAYGNEIAAFALTTGEKLWTCPNGENYMKSPELFIAQGLLWSKQLKGINTKTGEVVKELAQEMLGPMSHDRCYRNRVTYQYYLNSGSGGVDFVGLDGSSEYPNPWVRSTCGLSAMPANGMIYNGPFVCQCAIGSMLTGFNGLYNEKSGRYTVSHTPRLVEGPAFTRPIGEEAADFDWPTYRQSGARSGIGKASLPSKLDSKWEVKVGLNPTAPVMVGDHVYVAARDEHTLYCLEKETGKTHWEFTAGGPIDSPPTYHKGLLLTGCRDGWVYCLDATDGALRWQFNALPIQSLIADRGQLESAWPVNGSVLVAEGIAYFAAGRSSYLDGGVSVFGLNPETGEMIHNKVVAGPYEEGNESFPTRGERTFRLGGFKSGIFSVSDGKLFLRHQAFNPDLTPVSMKEIQEPHLIPSHGFLDSVPQHRSYWTVDVDLCYGGPTAITGYGPLGDTTAFAEGEFFEVRGYTPGRNLPKRGAGLTPFNTHSVFAGKLTAAKEGDVWISRKGKTIPEVGTWGKNWSISTPFAGHAISVCENAVMVAGVPMTEGFSQQDTNDAFRGEKGGVLWMIDKTSGDRLQEFILPAPPAWDSIAIASEMCVLSLKDGTIMGLAAE